MNAYKYCLRYYLPVFFAFCFNLAVCQSPYHVYFGNLHSHTSHSDGVASPADACAFARDSAGLDFLAVTDHIGSFHLVPYVPMNTPWQWDNCMSMADSFTVVGSFVGIAGWEWTSEKYGHINVFNTSDMIRDSLVLWYHYIISEFYNWLLNHPPAFAMFNHPGGLGIGSYMDYNNFEYISSALDSAIHLFEFQMVTQEPFYNLALSKGWHVSPVWNQDNHQYNWGTYNDCRAGIWADTLSRQSLFDAIIKGRTFSTMDKNASIWMDVDGTDMGSVLTVRQSATFHLSIADVDNENWLWLGLISENGTILGIDSITGNFDTTFTIDLTNEKWIYAKAMQADSNCLWSAPIYFENPNNSIVNFNYDANVLVYPNPTHDMVLVSANDAYNTVSVFDYMGVRHFDSQFSKEIKIDLREFAPGIYFIEILSPQKRVVKKIIKE